jgi:hypothetical protein
MNSLLDITKVVGTAEMDGLPYEVCAEAAASFDPAASQVSVNVRSFLRSIAQAHLGEVGSPAWLPAPETIREHVPFEDATALAKDVFSSWCHKVQHAIPVS